LILFTASFLVELLPALHGRIFLRLTSLLRLARERWYASCTLDCIPKSRPCLSCWPVIITKGFSLLRSSLPLSLPPSRNSVDFSSMRPHTLQQRLVRHLHWLSRVSAFRQNIRAGCLLSFLLDACSDNRSRPSKLHYCMYALSLP
jgi:hypothetical protein